MNEIEHLIKDLSEINAVSGYEFELYDFINAYCNDFAEVTKDKLNNIYIKTYQKKKGVTFFLEAHGDEVGFMVQSINSNGTINFVNIGGFRSNTFCGGMVLIKNRLGRNIRGTIVSASDKKIFEQITSNPCSEFVIDVGAVSYEDAINNFAVYVGAPIVPETRFSYEIDCDIFWGKAFDDRVGCVALLETISMCEKKQIHYIAVISAQEEVGSRGIKYAMKHIQADYAICFEGTLSNDNYLDSSSNMTSLKRGPILRMMDKSMIGNVEYLDQVIDIANINSIPIQVMVKNNGGTDASIIYNEYGIPTVVIGIPVRHIHTFVGITSKYDIENSILLAAKIIQKLV